MMKKLFALLLALCLSVTAAAAMAEEQPQLSFVQKAVEITEDHLRISVPADADVTNDEEGRIICEIAEIPMTVTVEISFTPKETMMAQRTAEGCHFFLFTVNERNYLVAALEKDGLSTAHAMMELGDDITLVISFDYPTSYTGSVVPEILSTLGYPLS